MTQVQCTSRLVIMCLLLVSMTAKVDGLIEVHERVRGHLIVARRKHTGLLTLGVLLHGHELRHVTVCCGGEGSLSELIRRSCATASEHEIVSCVG